MNAVWVAAIGSAGVSLGAALSALVYRATLPPKARRERKCARLKTELMLRCPHGELAFPGNKVTWQGWFTNKCGTLQWWCERCGKTASDGGQAERIMQKHVDRAVTAIREPAARQRWIKQYWGDVGRCQKIIARLRRAGCEVKAEL